ncbi:hypothetical protein ACLB2K_037395 [Fragaria x ananassa]
MGNHDTIFITENPLLPVGIPLAKHLLIRNGVRRRRGQLRHKLLCGGVKKKVNKTSLAKSKGPSRYNKVSLFVNPKKLKQTVEAPQLDFNGMPKSFKVLCCYAQNMIKMNGKCIMFDMEEKLFGSSRSTHILNEDILQLAGTHIYIYIYMYLYIVLEALDMIGSVTFVDPAVISAPWCGTNFVRSRQLPDRLKGAQNDQMFFIPYNSGDHWMLTIVHPIKDMVYFVDSFYRSITDSEWKHVVNDAINIFNRQRNKQGRCSKATNKHRMWLLCHALYEGLFFSWEEDVETTYLQEEIHEVRDEWAEFVSDENL